MLNKNNIAQNYVYNAFFRSNRVLFLIEIQKLRYIKKQPGSRYKLQTVPIKSIYTKFAIYGKNIKLLK
jgi:hypothetical protein